MSRNQREGHFVGHIRRYAVRSHRFSKVGRTFFRAELRARLLAGIARTPCVSLRLVK